MTLSEQAKDFDIWMDDIRQSFGEFYGEEITLFELMLLEYLEYISWISMYNAGASPLDAMDEFRFRRDHVMEEYLKMAARCLPKPETA